MPVVNPHIHTEQEILNSSFDETSGTLVTQNVVRDSSGTLTYAQTDELIKTLNELVSRLNVFGSMASSGAAGLRVAPISSVSTAVTGPLTDAQNTAANLVVMKAMDTYVGNRAVQSNIINVVNT